MTEPNNALFTAKEAASDQEVKWCPGCGDYSILKQMQSVIPSLGIKREDIVFISGIGCSSRFPYYMNTYGMHSIHGRAPAVASGLKMVNPDLSLWVMTGDGDVLSIGANHLIHLLRRNVDLNVLLFNNEIYGLTKGQYSPTSEIGKRTKSSPMGSIDHPFNPLALALGAEATFVARTIDRDTKHLRAILEASNLHKGTSFVEIYQNCNVFNDGAFHSYSDKKQKDEHIILLEEGQPLIFDEGRKGIRLQGLKPEIVDLEEGFSTDELWLHDSQDPTKAYLLSRFFGNEFPRPFGVLYQENRPCYEDQMIAQIEDAREVKGESNLDDVLRGSRSWTVD
jgi:2-oxoglutarate/2-oxoacid ferredoxin oxidoreductase subunit beta